jgi:alkylation response protein AidB-like acyl-CoA dehydrogenase
MSLTGAARGLSRQDLEMTLQSFRDYSERRLSPQVLLDLDAGNECPEEAIREMCGPGLGIPLVFLPEDHGGMGGSAYDVYRTCEALARVDLGVATGVLATLLGSDPLRFGTPEQKKLWLGRVGEGTIMAYGATEPQAGSDLAALRTVAVPAEEGGIPGYRLTGNKQWISNGGFADVYTILANAPGGPSWFVVEKGAPGFTHGKHEDKHGIRLSNTAALSLDNVFVPADRLVGGVEGQGLQQAQAVFGYTRLMVAAFGLGAGWAALDKVIPYSRQRVQAGAPLSEKQGYTHKLIVPHAVRLEAGRACIEETAERLDAAEENLQTEGAIAKYLATEAGNAACEAAIQALGGYGYTREYEVEKRKRDVRITTIYEGTSEIMEMTISRDRWQRHLKTRGEHYHDQARELEALEARHPGAGAGAGALALHALAVLLERCRAARLTRHQHVLLRLGELMARAEGSAALSRRAARAVEGTLDERSDARFPPEALAAASRVFSREAALDVATNGLRWVLGADSRADGAADLAGAVGLPAIQAAQSGLLADMDLVADALYGRRPGSASAPSSGS